MSTLRQAAPPGTIGMQHAVSVEQVYAADPASVPLARALVTSAVRDWGLAALWDDAALVVTELAANAVGQSVSGEIVVRVSWTVLYVVVEVGDRNPAGPPRPPREVAGTAEHGRGLLIWQTLSARRGWYRQGEWKVVWAALRKPAARQQAASRSQLRRAA